MGTPPPRLHPNLLLSPKGPTSKCRHTGGAGLQELTLEAGAQTAHHTGCDKTLPGQCDTRVPGENDDSKQAKAGFCRIYKWEEH